MQSLEPVSDGWRRGGAKSNLSVNTNADDANVEEICIEEEVEEETEGFEDDIIMEVEHQDNETVQILSDDDEECVMSPAKPPPPAKADEQMVDNIYARKYGAVSKQPAPQEQNQEIVDTQIDSEAPSTAKPLKAQPFNSSAPPESAPQLESQPGSQPSEPPPAQSKFSFSLPQPPPQPQVLDSQISDGIPPEDSQVDPGEPVDDDIVQELMPIPNIDWLHAELEEAMDTVVNEEIQDEVVSDEDAEKKTEKTTKGTFKDRHVVGKKGFESESS